MHALVNLLHEGVEMHPADGNVLRLKRFDKEIHEHRFAAPDPAPEIEPPGRLRRLAKQPALDRLGQAGADAFEFRQHGLLGVVRLQRPCGHPGGINVLYRHHEMHITRGTGLAQSAHAGPRGPRSGPRAGTSRTAQRARPGSGSGRDRPGCIPGLNCIHHNC